MWSNWLMGALVSYKFPMTVIREYHILDMSHIIWLILLFYSYFIVIYVVHLPQCHVALTFLWLNFMVFVIFHYYEIVLVSILLFSHSHIKEKYVNYHLKFPSKWSLFLQFMTMALFTYGYSCNEENVTSLWHFIDGSYG